MKTRPSLPAALLSIPAVASALAIENAGELDAVATGDSLPEPGQNINASSVFKNYFDAYTNGQFFLKTSWSNQYESPSTDIVSIEHLWWCSNLHFTDFKNGEHVGYTAHCTTTILTGLFDALAAGAQVSFPAQEEEFVDTLGYSAVYVPQTNVFECGTIAHTDNWAFRYWDDGRSNLSGIGWETHDEGDLSSNAATSAWSVVLKYELLSAEDAAVLLNTNSTDLTPEAFRDVYANVWIKAHEVEAATKNPNPEAELEAVEQVEEELNKTGTDEAEGTDTDAIPAASALVIENAGDLDAVASGDSLPKPGQNVDGTSVFKHYYDAYTDGQFFSKESWAIQREKPSIDVQPVQSVLWCSNVHFTDFKNGEPMGYTAQCVRAFLTDPSKLVDAGAQASFPALVAAFGDTASFSAVYVPQTNVFESAYTAHADNWVKRYWDDGRSSLVGIGWETHDEGDLSPNQATSAWNSAMTFELLSAEDAASILNINSTNLTPEAFGDIYADIWIKTHEEEATTMNPNPEAELEAVEQVEEDLENEMDASGSDWTSALAVENINQLDAFASGDSLPKPGQNVDGTSVFKNYYDAYTNGQFFLKTSLTFQYESPSADKMSVDSLRWCSNLHFTDVKNGEPMGYTAQCVFAKLADSPEMLAAGAQVTGLESTEFDETFGFSSVYVPQTNAFECVTIKTTDNWVNRHWDDGRSSLVGIGWETHDEGDLDPNAGTSALSVVLKLEPISADDAAVLLNINSTNLTPEAFDDVYADVWIKGHEEEAATKNPNPEAELEAVEQVKDELNQTGTDEVEGTDTDANAPDDGASDGASDSSSGTGRKLTRAAFGAVFVALCFLGV